MALDYARRVLQGLDHARPGLHLQILASAEMRVSNRAGSGVARVTLCPPEVEASGETLEEHRSGSGAVFGRLGFGKNFAGSSPVARDQAAEVVTVRSVGAESFLIKQALDAAAQANLIGAILRADRPTHIAVPATAEEHHAGCP